MLINKTKLPWLITTIEKLIESFPEAKEFIDANAHKYTEELVSQTSEMDILHQICIGFFKRQIKHYVVLGMTDRILVMEMDVRNALIIDNNVMICTSEEQLKKMYVNTIFLFYSKVDKSIKSIPHNARTYDMAESIHRRINTLNIQVLMNE